MYADKPSKVLRAGDVITLTLEDVSRIARHPSILEVFKQYSEDLQYPRNLWAILNKPCDMIHDGENKRYFTANLFLSPLQGLKNVLKQKTVKEILFQQKRAMESVRETFHQYIQKNKNTIPSFKDTVTSLLYSVESEIESLETPEEILDYLISYINKNKKNKQQVIDLESFRNSSIWKKNLKRHNPVKIDKSIIILKGDKPKPLVNLFRNQLDSQGIFFYEPHKDLSSVDHDLAYVIQIEDMITLKIKKEFQRNGELPEILIKNRKISLSESFSDRLLNIMGNYFSRIATDDVSISEVTDLYKKIYPETFFTSEKQFNEEKGQLKSLI